MKKLVFGAGMFAAAVALAYLPPVDVKNGIEVRIGTFDQSIDTNPDRYKRKLGVVEVDGTKPRQFPVVMSNKTDRAVSGELKVWINDDWTVKGPAGKVALPARSGITLMFEGSPLERSLAALYPVHATFKADGSSEVAHPIAIFMANKPHSGVSVAKELKRGSVMLDGSFRRRVMFEVKGKVINAPDDDSQLRSDYGVGFTQLADVSSKGIVKRGFRTHPPYAKGAGFVWCDYPLYLPKDGPITFSFFTMVGSEKSDGTENKVFVLEDGVKPQEVYSSVVKAKDGWKEGSVDLSKWAGKRIGLRLWTGPGPKMQTSFDGGGWGEPIISVGALPVVPDEATWQLREGQALAVARRALEKGTSKSDGAYLLEANGQRFGVGVIEGNRSLVDGVIAFTDGKESLVYRGFSCEVDRIDMSKSAIPVELKATVSVAPEGALRIHWTMPGASRSKDGTPRYTRLALGPASQAAWRAYAGFGNVIEDPKHFRLTSSGFNLSTRHVGADYRNGISLLQATDVVPDALECDSVRNVFSLVAHHDAMFTLIPGGRGAFETARRFWKICGYRPSPGHERLVGRMCLDQWGGDYGKAASDIRLAAKYGLTDSFFVKHVWQRWGYDYRLPEIYPPAGDSVGFGEMVKACKETGIFFCPHDNYTDIYPDADKYSYDLVVFNLDGTPQKAWYNIGRLALSYRWAPHAFRPWCLRNAKLLKEGYDPDGIFIDVLTAHGPFDYLDREGCFHSKNETSKHWANAFQTYREGLGRSDAVTISEAGQDHLVGTLDAGQSDHFGAAKLIGASSFVDSERTPWHDMATHNRFLLLAGGLGGRYQEEQWHKGGSSALHGYASDDYLNNTVMGGRNPMVNGPFCRGAVMTYWLLHDVCASLARAEFTAHAFGKDIHQQHTSFSNGGNVWSNRKTNDVWNVAGVELPPYGFMVKIPNGLECGVIVKDGQRVGYSKSKDVLFVDGRMPALSGDMPQAKSSVSQAKVSGTNMVTIDTDWEFMQDLHMYRSFVHVERDTGIRSRENIVFQSTIAFESADALSKPGLHHGTMNVAFPKNVEEGLYSVWYGMWNPKSNARLAIEGNDAGRRIIAGYVRVSKSGDRISRVEWINAGDISSGGNVSDRVLGINRSCKPVDFGGVVTAGAIRFDHPKGGEWRLTALPNSKSFQVTIDLEAFGAGKANVLAVEPIDPADPKVDWKQEDAKLTFTFPSRAFSYRIRF